MQFFVVEQSLYSDGATIQITLGDITAAEKIVYRHYQLGMPVKLVIITSDLKPYLNQIRKSVWSRLHSYRKVSLYGVLQQRRWRLNQ